MNYHLTNKISARLGTHAADLVVKANDVRWRLNAVVRRAWRQLLRGLKPGVWHFHTNRLLVETVLVRMQHELWISLHTEAVRLWQWTHRQQAHVLAIHVPEVYTRPALTAALRESAEADVLEAQAPRLTKTQERKLVHQRLFPAPKKSELQAILHQILPQAGWLHVGDDNQQRKLPRAVGNVVAGALAQGRTVRQVAADLRPLLEGSRSRANMTARTLSAYVNTERTLKACENLGAGAVIGYIVHSCGGESARPDHALRSGTAYYRRPKAGQWGMNVMPHPPVDNGGPNEEEIGIRRYCRCFLTPVWAATAADEPEARYFTDKAKRLIPDPAHYVDWWTQANDAQKQAAAGVRRLRVAQQVLGRDPDWLDLISAFDGRLLSLAELQKETPRQRALRLAELQRIVAENRTNTKQELGV